MTKCGGFFWDTVQSVVECFFNCVYLHMVREGFIFSLSKLLCQ